jgi:hypothetical protein
MIVLELVSRYGKRPDRPAADTPASD